MAKAPLPPSADRLFMAFLSCVAICFTATGQPGGYGYGHRILISGSRIMGTSTLTNFPVLVDISDPSLRSTAQGGHMQSASGYDIQFTAGDCSTALPFEIESYSTSSSTGHLVAWVLVPLLVPGVDQGIHLYYGKSGVTTDPSSSAVWTDYHAVFHFQTTPMHDNSPNGYDATNHGTTAQNPAYIYKGRADDGTQWMELSSFPNLTTSYSMSAWVYTTDITKTGQRIFADDVSNTGGYAFSISDEVNGTLRFFSRSSTPVSLDTPSGTIANNTWYYATAVVDIAAHMKYIYVNGVLKASGSYTGTWGTDAGNASIAGETASGETANRLKGRMDELRVRKGAVSTDWALTEYNNQTDPSSFCTLSAEYSASGLCITLPIELLNFDAVKTDDRRVMLHWATASEQDNDHFIVERSVGDDNWTAVTELPGAGNSDQVLHYAAYDDQPSNGLNYYRLRQVDTDGAYSLSPVRVVDVGGMGSRELALSPNPASSEVAVGFSGLLGPVLTIVDMRGRVVRQQEVHDPASVRLDIADLPRGIYLVSLTDGRTTKSARLSIEH